MATLDPVKILLVEDDIYVSQSYSYALRSSGYIVEAALNVIEARKLLKRVKPDLILLDLIMPGINGFDYLIELKKDKKTKDIPVVIVSNLCHEDDVEKCRKLGAMDFLIKSNFYMKDVVARIPGYVGERE